MLVFTSTKHDAEQSLRAIRRGRLIERIHGTAASRSGNALQGSSGEYRCSTRRTSRPRKPSRPLQHVVNVDVPTFPRLIQRVGRTARAERTGDPSPSCRRRRRATSAPSRGRWAPAPPGDTVTESTTPRARSGSRPDAEASRRSAPGRRAIASARRRRPSAGAMRSAAPRGGRRGVRASRDPRRGGGGTSGRASGAAASGRGPSARPPAGPDDPRLSRPHGPRSREETKASTRHGRRYSETAARRRVLSAAAAGEPLALLRLSDLRGWDGPHDAAPHGLEVVPVPELREGPRPLGAEGREDVESTNRRVPAVGGGSLSFAPEDGERAPDRAGATRYSSPNRFYIWAGLVAP